MAVKTSSDIQIENKSYTNKDFSQIYPELLDLVKKLTNKWDPETTNESDPGLVLLKLLAFIADKNNYNIDKNILEQFMPSVTQEENMRKLCDMMGYNIGYYRSATTDISFTYLGGNDTLDKVLGINQEDGSTSTPTSSTMFHIKAFDTSFKTEDNIVYTLLEDIEITDSQFSDTKRAIQGQIKALNLNQGSTTSSEATKIQLYNLDENNRIYIPDVMVAENGIFINKEVYNSVFNADAWRRVDNLNDQELGSKVFKFGFDSSKNLPYIEFPSDISDLIEDGLEIYYIVSDGVEGNVSPNTITSFNTYSFDVSGVSEIEDSCYSLNNATSVAASEPETIDEAYKNFKKTVGTFNTLVSCKDYSNYIYTYQDEETNNHVVSNVQAMDLRTDPNKSVNLLNRDIDGITYYETHLKDNITSSDNAVILHGTVPNNYTITNKQGYEQTYTLLSGSAVNDIEEDLSDVKTISHKLTIPQSDEIAFIEERYTLNINISTKYKVNVSEQSSILSNVVKALYNNFNAREVEFGEEIPYDEIVDTIQNADERIKLVVVDDPDINPYIVSGTSTNKTAHLFDPKTVEDDRKIIVENILGGRIQLYIKDESLLFDYNMNMGSLMKYDHLAAIKTDLTINVPKTNTSGVGAGAYELKKNESIQIVEDSYISTVTYPAYVYYGMDENHKIETKKGVPYKLGQNEKLYIYYTDTNDVKQVEDYGEGTIVRTNEFNLPQGQNTSASRWVDPKTKEVYSDNNKNNPDYISMYALGTNETIEILKLNEVVLNKNNTRCFWYSRPIIGEKDVLNQEDNGLVFYKDGDSNTYYHILEEDELFVYPSDDNLVLYSVGSGTKLQVTFQDLTKKDPFTDGTTKYGENTIYLEQSNSQYVNNKNVIDLDQLQEAVNSQNINNFENAFGWNDYDFPSNPLHIVETTLTTYIEGDTISRSDNSLEINSKWQSLPVLSFDTSVGVKEIGDITNSKIRAILSFTGSSTQPQQLEGGQKITLYYYNSGDSGWIDGEGYYDSEKENAKEPRWTDVPLEENKYIQINTTTNNYNDIILRSPYYEESDTSASLIFEGRYSVPCSAVTYEVFPYEENSSSALWNLIVKKDAKASASRDEYTFKYLDLKEILDKSNQLIISAPSNVTNLYINVFDQITGQTRLFIAEKNEDNNEFTLDLSYIVSAAIEDDERNVLISKPILLNINPTLEEQLGEDVVNDIKEEIEKQTTFDYLADLSNSKLITSYNLVNSFFDYNNVYNPLTIAKIDFSSDKYKCNIVSSSRK